MKLTTFLILGSIVCVFANSTYSQNKKLNLNMKNATVKEVLSAIEDQSEFKFMYSGKIIDVNRQVEINKENTEIEDALKSLFAGTDVNYTIKDRIIVLSSTSSELQPSQQQKTISGKVTDSSGTSLPGVSVVVKGTTTGVITDFDGKYTLAKVPENAILQFSFVGMKGMEVAVAGKSSINVMMEEEAIGIEEVVAIGYGTTKKSDLTGSVVSISEKDLGDRVAGSVSSLLQGRVSGLDVTGSQIRVRGVTTLNNTDPLFVIDGILGGDMSTISADNIKSMEVLKDASSTAIYGARGANGVIIITTKSGTEGPLKVNFNGYYGVTNLAKKWDVLNAKEYIDLVKDLRASDGKDLTDKLKSPDVLVDRTDWQDAITRTSHTQEYNLDFSGGSKDANYFVGTGYKKYESIYIGPETEQFFLNVKNTFKIKNIITIGDNVFFRRSIETGVQPFSLISAVEMPPYYEIYDSKNFWGYSNVDRIADLTDVYNPVPQSRLAENDNKGLNYMLSAFVEIEPIKGLKWKSQFTAKGANSNIESYSQAYVNGGAQTYNSSLTKSSSHSYSPLLENYLTFDKTVGEHTVSLLAGNTYTKYAYGGTIGISGRDFANEEVRLVTKGKTYNVATDERYHEAALSYFGRVNYNYKGRYLFTANYRRDASNKFAPANRWGNFPSLALGWKIHEEGFMQKYPAVSQLKLRTSWGISGNDAIGSYRYLSNVWSKSFYVFNGALVNGATVMNNYSPEIKWESTESTNIGLDLGLFDNKMVFTADYFIKNTNDILFGVPRPLSTGYGENNQGGDAIVNAASVKNKGFEFTAEYRGTVGEVNFRVLGNLTYVTNKVTSLGLGQPFMASNGISRTDVGNPIGYFYGYVADKIYMKQSEVDADNAAAKAKGNSYYQTAFTAAGDVRFKDLNDDGKVDSKDRQMIGSPIPDFTFGLNGSLSYKGFDLNLVLSGVAGNELYFGNFSSLRGMNRIKNQTTYVLNRWKSESNPGNGKVPRALLGDKPQNLRNSSMMVEDGSYLRMQQLSLGYSFNKAWLSGVTNNVFSNLRAYVSADNLFVLTKFTGLDPEVGGDNLSRGISGTDYPSRTFVLGLQFGL